MHEYCVTESRNGGRGFFHQQANWCYQLAWQCFDLAIAYKLNAWERDGSFLIGCSSSSLPDRLFPYGPERFFPPLGVPAQCGRFRKGLVRRTLMRLSIEHREVIDLVYYHEKSVDEVAQILDVPPATVKTRMFYARKKLAKLVNGAENIRC
jgi:predicted DNA-binding protein (UPF0251 family)